MDQNTRQQYAAKYAAKPAVSSFVFAGQQARQQRAEAMRQWCEAVTEAQRERRAYSWNDCYRHSCTGFGALS